MTYLPAAQIPEAACPLLEASLQQGFAAPAPAIATWCRPYNVSSEYRTALEAIPSMATVYAPTTRNRPRAWPATAAGHKAWKCCGASARLPGRGVPPAWRPRPTAAHEPAAESRRHQWLRNGATAADQPPITQGHSGPPCGPVVSWPLRLRRTRLDQQDRSSHPLPRLSCWPAS